MHALAAAVDAMPPSQRSTILARFDQANRQLEARGLMARLRRPPEDADGQSELNREYFAAGIPCPFLEGGACIVHGQRPTICREYHVVSPAERCDHPYEGGVEVVDVPDYMANLITTVLGEALETRVKVTPLTLGLDWVRDHPARLPAVDGAAVVVEVARRLATAL